MPSARLLEIRITSPGATGADGYAPKLFLAMSRNAKVVMGSLLGR